MQLYTMKDIVFIQNLFLNPKMYVVGVTPAVISAMPYKSIQGSHAPEKPEFPEIVLKLGSMS